MSRYLPPRHLGQAGGQIIGCSPLRSRRPAKQSGAASNIARVHQTGTAYTVSAVEPAHPPSWATLSGAWTPANLRRPGPARKLLDAPSILYQHLALSATDSLDPRPRPTTGVQVKLCGDAFSLPVNVFLGNDLHRAAVLYDMHHAWWRLLPQKPSPAAAAVPSRLRCSAVSLAAHSQKDRRTSQTWSDALSRLLDTLALRHAIPNILLCFVQAQADALLLVLATHASPSPAQCPLHNAETPSSRCEFSSQNNLKRGPWWSRFSPLAGRIVPGRPGLASWGPCGLLAIR